MKTAQEVVSLVTQTLGTSLTGGPPWVTNLVLSLLRRTESISLTELEKLSRVMVAHSAVKFRAGLCVTK